MPSLIARLRRQKAEKHDDANLRTTLGLDIARRTADRVLAYAGKRGFDRTEAQAWSTRAGLRILDSSAAVVIEHMRRERRPHAEIAELVEASARWCRWGIWAGAKPQDAEEP